MDLSQKHHASADDSTLPEPAPLWSALNRFQRRIVGVLAEKSKTTPDVYPMTANSICNGANQKSNRKPQMDIDNDLVENTLLELRHLGAIIEVISDGRVPKYKHALYQWLDVEKKELSVLTELLLRGAQSLGDLRSRAARMDPIADQRELKQILGTLIAKNLVLELTPAGRGQLVTHNLYHDEELKKVRAGVGAETANLTENQTVEPQTSLPGVVTSTGVTSTDSEALARRVDALEEQVALMRRELDEIKS